MIIAIRDDAMGQFLELLQIIDYQAPKESGAIFQGWFIDDDLCSFGFDSFHDTLDTALAEVIGIRLHG